MWFRHRDHCDLILSLTAGQIGHCDRHQNPATDKNTHLNSWWFCFIIFVMWNGEVCFRGSVGLVCVFQWWQAESGPVCPGRWRLTCVWNGRGSVTAVSIPASSQQPWWNVIWSLPLKLKCCQVVLLSGKVLIIDFSIPLVFMRHCVLSEWLHLSVLSHCDLDDVVDICVFFFFFVFLLREHHYNYCWYLRLVMWTNIIM